MHERVKRPQHCRTIQSRNRRQIRTTTVLVSDVNEQTEQFKEVMNQAAATAVGKKKTAKNAKENFEWINEECEIIENNLRRNPLKKASVKLLKTYLKIRKEM